MYYQQLQSLISAQLGMTLNFTPEEWKNRKVTKETLLSLGLKGSPKLSKVLVALGLPEKTVSLILGTQVDKVTSIRSDELSCLEQGNSIHFSSCQATDKRAKWKGGSSARKILQDLPFMGKSLFIWTVGQPMSIDGSGYKARAKVRVVLDDSKEKIIGLYIDKIYGQVDLLLANLLDLEKWSLEHFGEKIPLLERGNEIRGFIPSALGGYQDTLPQNGFGCFRIKKVNSLLYQAYRSRKKVGGVYLHELKEVEVNLQKEYPFTLPPRDTTFRGHIPDFVRPVIKHWHLMVGKPQERINYNQRWNKYSIIIKNKINLQDCRLVFQEGTYEFFIEKELIYKRDNKGLHICNPFKGFLPPVEIPYINSEKCLRVIQDIPEFGFHKAEKLPYINGKVIRDIPEFGFMRAEYI